MSRPYFLKKNKREEGENTLPFPFGVFLLFVSFLVLGIFTLAALTLISAKNNAVLSRKYADHQTAYYTAANEAQDRIAALNRKLQAAGGTEETGKNAPSRVSFRITIDDQSDLSVSLQAGTSSYRIIKWRVESSGTWNPKQTIPVMPPSVS